MPKNNLSIEEWRTRKKELEESTQPLIEALLAERKRIDEELAELGYTGESKPQGEKKKRIRRTRAEIEAARAAGEK